MALAAGGSYSKAITTEEEALEIVKSLKLSYYTVGALCKMSGWAASDGDAKKAVTLAEEALTVRSGGNLETMALVLANKAASQFKEAIKAAKDGLETAKTAADQRELMVAYTILCKAYFLGSDPSGALNSAMSALEIVRELGDKKEESNLLHEVAKAHIEQKRYENAVQP